LHLSGDRGPAQVGGVGSLIGVLTDVRFHDEVLRLSPGDLLVMYTDGVTEGRRGREFFGEERLSRAILRQRDADLPAQGILGEVLEFQQGTARDDIAVVTVRVPPTPDTLHPHLPKEKPT
jgi:sigma-B regulation protein RsbU (phosphoserine phosphatase)